MDLDDLLDEIDTGGSNQEFKLNSNKKIDKPSDAEEWGDIEPAAVKPEPIQNKPMIK